MRHGTHVSPGAPIVPPVLRSFLVASAEDLLVRAAKLALTQARAAPVVDEAVKMSDVSLTLARRLYRSRKIRTGETYLSSRPTLVQLPPYNWTDHATGTERSEAAATPFLQAHFWDELRDLDVRAAMQVPALLASVVMPSAAAAAMAAPPAAAAAMTGAAAPPLVRRSSRVAERAEDAGAPARTAFAAGAVPLGTVAELVDARHVHLQYRQVVRVDGKRYCIDGCPDLAAQLIGAPALDADAVPYWVAIIEIKLESVMADRKQEAAVKAQVIVQVCVCA